MLPEHIIPSNIQKVQLKNKVEADEFIMDYKRDGWKIEKSTHVANAYDIWLQIDAIHVSWLN